MSRIAAILAFSLVAVLLLSFGWIFSSAFAIDDSPDDHGQSLARVSPQLHKEFNASSNEPGDSSGYEVTFTASSDLPAGVGQITIELEDFGFPTTVEPSHISIESPFSCYSESSNERVSCSTDAYQLLGVPPAAVEVSISGESLSLTIDDMNPVTDQSDDIRAGDWVVVRVSHAAGITNPTEGGGYTAVITNNQDDTEITTYEFIVRFLVKLSQSTGASGVVVTATGQGFKNGTSLGFFLDDNVNGMLDSGEILLCQVASVGSDDTGSCSFTVSSPPFALGKNYVNAVDGRSNYASDTTSDEQKFVLLPDPTATPEPTPRPTSTPRLTPTPTPRPTTTPYPTPTPTPIQPAPTAVYVPAPEPPQLPGSGGTPPHIFAGVANLNGSPAGQGVAVDAYDGGRLIGATVTQAGGRFSIHVHRAEGVITFRVNNQAAAESWTAWRQGQVTTGFNLTAGGVSSNEQDPARLFAALPDLVRAFGFDNATKRWDFFDPAAADVSTLTRFMPQHSYWLLVSHTTRLLLNGVERDLYCVEDNCWNLIVW